MSGEIHDLAAAYALDALLDVDHARFTRHLQTCEQCQRDVSSFHETAATLAETTAVTPPPGSRDQVLSRVATTPQLDTGRDGRRGWWLGIAAAAAVAIVSLFGYTLFGGDGLVGAVLDDPAALVFEAAPTDAGTGMFDRVTVVYSEDHEAAVLVAEGMAQAGLGRTYQMWLVDETGPQPAGTFRPDGDGNATIPIDGELTPGLTFAVTEEPDDGVPSPTGEILLTAAIDI